MKTLGKGIVAMRNELARFIQDHAVPGAETVRIMIVSDKITLHEKPAASYAAASMQLGPAVYRALFETTYEARRPLDLIQEDLNNSAAAAQWISMTRWPEGLADAECTYFDLSALMLLLGDLIASPKFDVRRTVFMPDGKGAKSAPVVESTMGGQYKRDALRWDSNAGLTLPASYPKEYDLVLLRRGLCYCAGAGKPACCGCTPNNGSDVAFLAQMYGLLAPGNKSACYLSGASRIGKKAGVLNDFGAPWQAAMTTFKKSYGAATCQAVPGKANTIGSFCGIFISRGRSMDSRTLKIPD
jgi:hypothetical protein